MSYGMFSSVMISAVVSGERMTSDKSFVSFLPQSISDIKQFFKYKLVCNMYVAYLLQCKNFQFLVSS